MDLWQSGGRKKLHQKWAPRNCWGGGGWGRAIQSLRPAGFTPACGSAVGVCDAAVFWHGDPRLKPWVSVPLRGFRGLGLGVRVQAVVVGEAPIGERWLDHTHLRGEMWGTQS